MVTTSKFERDSTALLRRARSAEARLRKAAAILIDWGHGEDCPSDDDGGHEQTPEKCDCGLTELRKVVTLPSTNPRSQKGPSGGTSLSQGGP